MTCHSSNCFSIVWGQGNGPLVTSLPSSCDMTPNIQSLRWVRPIPIRSYPLWRELTFLAIQNRPIARFTNCSPVNFCACYYACVAYTHARLVKDSSRLSNLCWSHISIPLCSKLWYCEAEGLPFCLVGLLRIYLQLFWEHSSHTVKKYRHSLLGLSSKVFTFGHLFTHRSDFFNNLAISLTEWPEYRKNRCLSPSTNSVGL